MNWLTVHNNWVYHKGNSRQKVMDLCPKNFRWLYKHPKYVMMITKIGKVNLNVFRKYQHNAYNNIHIGVASVITQSAPCPPPIHPPAASLPHLPPRSQGCDSVVSVHTNVIFNLWNKAKSIYCNQWRQQLCNFTILHTIWLQATSPMRHELKADKGRAHATHSWL